MVNKEYANLPQIIETNNGAIEYVRSNDDLVYYKYQNILVPRVSAILREAIGKNGLIDWAGRVGYRKMNEIRESALKVGSVVHEMIEYFLIHGEDKEVNYSDYEMTDHEIEQVHHSYNAFNNWLQHLIYEAAPNSNNFNTFEVIGLEVPVVCPWYGGTIDCIAKINGYTYIIDFKTSRQINYEYLLQVDSYAWMVNNGYCDICKKVDGVGILRFDKSSAQCEEYFLNYCIPWQADILFQYTRTFWAVCNSFYNLMYSGKLLNDTLKQQDTQLYFVEKEALENKKDGKK